VPAQALPIEAVVNDPEIRGGRPIVAGTTLRVSDLAAYHTLAGLTPDQLCAQFDLDLSRAHAALSHYFRHKAEIDAEIRENEQQQSCGGNAWRPRAAA
jgi:uncharacterized protein (DUF433 family)